MTSPDQSLSIAICTRNRPASVALTLSHIWRQARHLGTGVEVILVDDGEIEDATVEAWAMDAVVAGATLRYLRKSPDMRGLYESRKLAVLEASSEIVLFLDDDVTIGRNYLSRVLNTFADNPDIAGVGGVDQLSLPAGQGGLGEAFARLFLMSSGDPGKLSASGMNYSQAMWRLQADAFASEFLHGCNMAFRRSALLRLPDMSWLTGHSPCEDLVLSYEASRWGKLVVDPNLRVYHLAIEGGRGNMRERLKARVGNAARFQIHRKGRLGLPFIWSACGMLAKDLAKAIKDTRSPFVGIRDVLFGYAGAIR
ncbi:glycosyltransferase [Bosea sp. RAC05]|uniref:glycosyltransferase n=1 Tax=Bosea sp. RAC05 TaxID=1842539 RepID=UPI00083E239D|nr:glycosyltransferase family 2 protein [Bosea sp. RAC05]AOG03386.1 glycosyl transferase 21 family protein [Bosea sp. RAC05]